MKKQILCVLLLLCIAIYVSPCFALSTEAFERKLNTLTREVYKLAEDILAFNKPAFETQLTKKEQSSGILWNRVCAKDQTLVWGYARKDKKFIPIYFVTNDPKFTFSGGIRAGADVKVLERFFGDSIKSIGQVEGKTIRIGPNMEETDYVPASIHIKCANGVIKEIFFCEEENMIEGTDSAYSSKAIEFKDKKAKEMGLSPFVNFTEELTPEEREREKAEKKDALQAKFQRILREAERGDIDSQNELGLMYWSGTDGVSEDGVKAVYWFKKAAAQNDTWAMECLGKIYRNGAIGVKKDDKEADFWFDKKHKTIQAARKNTFQTNAFITGDKVNIRSKPNTSSKIVKQLNAGEAVKATKQTKAKDGIWYFIQTASGTQGWVFGKYIKLN